MSATELEPSEVEQRQKLAYGLDQKIRVVMRRGREALWDLAEALYEFNEARGWTAMDCDSLNEWLADPELGMKASTYRRYVKLWRDTVVKRQLDVETLRQLDISKFDVVLPSVDKGFATIEQAVHDVGSMGMADLREQYYGGKDPAAAHDDPIEGTATPTSGDRVKERDAGEPSAAKPVAPAVIQAEHPMTTEWAEVVKTAKSRKTSITKHVTQRTSWERCGKGDGNDVMDWIVPMRAEIRAMYRELCDVIDSGQPNPRIDAAIVRAGLQAVKELLP
jgi:hypothetical protein